jgi:N-acetylmuramoyl-L-alanine amidase
MFRQLWFIFLAGIVVAFIYTSFTPYGLLYWSAGNEQPSGEASSNSLHTSTPPPHIRIGIVAGHWKTDEGATCSDGLKEVDVNLEVASYVQKILTDMNFEVDLLEEYDDRLEGYDARILVSIHADTCTFTDLGATGFKVAPTRASERQEKANRLVDCINKRYHEITGLSFHSGITKDMSSYHAFDEIDPSVTAAIIETGFLNLDRQILTQDPDLVAQGIVFGILCYIYNEDASLPINTNTP